MDADMQEKRTAPLQRRLTRRSLVGGALAASSVAVAYAAVGGRIPLGDSNASSPADALTDADAISRESVRISHLLRRVGFGASAAEHEHYQTLGLEGTITELVNYATVDDSEALELAGHIEINAQNRGAPPVWWLIRMANTRRPLQEKMTLFWHGLLTSQMSVVRDPLAMVAQNEFFRGHALDSFPSILTGISMDPAMMVYLDTSGSHRRAPNENYARELMELFSLGEGNYSEQDVREAARAFTGWQVPRARREPNRRMLLEPVFRRRRFDNGTKTFLGHQGNFHPDEIVAIVVEQPAAADYITRRLFSFFVYQDPTDTDLAPFIDIYNTSGGNIGAVVEAMLRSDVFYSPRAYRALVKSPIEYVVGATKALGHQTTIAESLTTGRRRRRRRTEGALGPMGQVPFEPPNVAGWPGGAAWLNSATIFARLNFINDLTSRPAGGPVRGPSSPVAPDLGTAAQLLAHYLPLVLDDNVSDEARQILFEYAGGPDAPLTTKTLKGLVYLILGAPQFHLS